MGPCIQAGITPCSLGLQRGSGKNKAEQYREQEARDAIQLPVSNITDFVRTYRRSAVLIKCVTKVSEERHFCSRKGPTLCEDYPGKTSTILLRLCCCTEEGIIFLSLHWMKSYKLWTPHQGSPGCYSWLLVAGLCLHLPKHPKGYYVNWLFHYIFFSCKKPFYFDRKHHFDIFLIHFPLFSWHILFLRLWQHECLGEGKSRLHHCEAWTDLFEQGGIDAAVVAFNSISPAMWRLRKMYASSLVPFFHMDAATLHVTLPGRSERWVTCHRYVVLPELPFVISSNMR